METPDVLKQLEINFGLVLNDLEFASHELDARMKDAARCVLLLFHVRFIYADSSGCVAHGALAYCSALKQL